MTVGECSSLERAVTKQGHVSLTPAWRTRRRGAMGGHSACDAKPLLCTLRKSDIIRLKDSVIIRFDLEFSCVIANHSMSLASRRAC